MIRASTICIAALSLFHLLLAAEPAQARDADATRAPILVAQKGADAPATEVQKVQRLLKFLSQRNPARFGKVDPGPVDGMYGAEVKAAIIKFQRIVGVPINPVVDRELLSQIISALAETPDASETALAGCAENPANPACNDAKSKPAPPPVAAKSEPPKPRIVTRMFVQLASLPSLPRAKREWRRLKRTNEFVLSDAEVQFRQVQIKGRGTYYRVFVGPFENMADARNICVGLGREGRNCIVVRRKVTVTEPSTKAVAAPKQTDKPDKAEAPAKPETVNRPTAATDATPVKTVEPPKSAEAPAKPETPSEPVAAADAAPAEAKEPTTPEVPTAASEEIFSLTLQAPILTPGSVPATEAPKDTGDASAVTTPGTESMQAKDKDNAAPAPAAESQQAASTESNPDTTAQAEQTPTVKTEEAAALAAARPGGGSKPPTPTAGSAEKGTAAGAAAPAATASKVKPETAAKPKEKPAADSKANAGKANEKKKEKSKATVGPLGFLFERLPRVTWPRLLLLAAIVAGGIGLYYVWRRRRLMGRSRRGMPAGLPKTITEAWTSALEENSPDKPETFDELRSDFESPQMRQSRTVRDAFLRDVLEHNDIEVVNGVNAEAGLSVNRGLKRLLETDPARYKQIFLNWLFMDRMGAALDRHEVSADQLDDSINREFALLRSYFRIHLLELDDRHRLRSSLPGLFHCLVFPRP